uniref:Ubiquitin-like domain-containing protein n=1 Tax=Pinguiococcus pyrenoidosus TaxID=172671 RepID=A0A7R9U6U8_9STRA|mmetsp:Transcript_17321/g.66011  ORF Transcript_17321/g.66011 Transcript_17321/m.66011 type:complete len:255 (+) Transcript_17321:40-804(+)
MGCSSSAALAQNAGEVEATLGVARTLRRNPRGRLQVWNGSELEAEFQDVQLQLELLAVRGPSITIWVALLKGSKHKLVTKAFAPLHLLRRQIMEEMDLFSDKFRLFLEGDTTVPISFEAHERQSMRVIDVGIKQDSVLHLVSSTTASSGVLQPVSAAPKRVGTIHVSYLTRNGTTRTGAIVRDLGGDFVEVESLSGAPARMRLPELRPLQPAEPRRWPIEQVARGLKEVSDPVNPFRHYPKTGIASLRIRRWRT